MADAQKKIQEYLNRYNELGRKLEQLKAEKRNQIEDANRKFCGSVELPSTPNPAKAEEELALVQRFDNIRDTAWDIYTGKKDGDLELLDGTIMKQNDVCEILRDIQAIENEIKSISFEMQGMMTVILMLLNPQEIQISDELRNQTRGYLEKLPLNALREIIVQQIPDLAKDELIASARTKKRQEAEKKGSILNDEEKQAIMKEVEALSLEALEALAGITLDEMQRNMLDELEGKSDEEIRDSISAIDITKTFGLITNLYRVGSYVYGTENPYNRIPNVDQRSIENNVEYATTMELSTHVEEVGDSNNDRRLSIRNFENWLSEIANDKSFTEIYRIYPKTIRDGLKHFRPELLENKALTGDVIKFDGDLERIIIPSNEKSAVVGTEIVPGDIGRLGKVRGTASRALEVAKGIIDRVMDRFRGNRDSGEREDD